MCNIIAPSIMIGEKGSDHILGKQPLDPSIQEPVYDPTWQTEQR